MQDELGSAIVAQVDPELMKDEGRRTAGRRSHDLTAQDLLLQALPGIYRLEHSGFVDARRLLESSLRADPGSSVAHGWLAYWHLLYVGQGWATDPAESSAEAARLAERAVMLDPGDARALTLAGHVRGFLGKHPEEASALHERAISLNPNLAIAWCFSGLSHFYLGRHEEALRRVNQAIRLSPSDPHAFFFDMALIMPHLMSGDCASAVEAGRRAVELNPLFSSAYKGYLAALGWMPGNAIEFWPRSAGQFWPTPRPLTYGHSDGSGGLLWTGKPKWICSSSSAVSTSSVSARSQVWPRSSAFIGALSGGRSRARCRRHSITRSGPSRSWAHLRPLSTSCSTRTVVRRASSVTRPGAFIGGS
jgi:tetratricopeptide (TPR) repeat protein